MDPARGNRNRLARPNALPGTQRQHRGAWSAVRGGLHDDDDLDGAPESDSFEVEGIQAFNRLTAAVTGLESRLGVLEHGLGSKATQAERAASTAATAAQSAIRAAEHVEAVARAEARSWTAYATCLVVAGTLAAGGLGYLLGEQAGQATGEAAGYKAAVNANAAASWTNTPAGQAALTLDRAGSVDRLARCDGQGWKVVVQAGRRSCYPHAAADGKVYGWTLP